jgi:hypothetical protein
LSYISGVTDLDDYKLIFCHQQPSAEPDPHEPNPVLDPEGAWAYRRIMEIETKKHELFYLLAGMIKRYPGNKYSKINNELPHNLFPHIVPNPNAPIWYNHHPKQLHMHIKLISIHSCGNYL